MSLFPAICVLKGQAMNIEAEFQKQNNPDKKTTDQHKYTMKSINSAIAILEKQYNKNIKPIEVKLRSVEMSRGLYNILDSKEILDFTMCDLQKKFTERDFMKFKGLGRGKLDEIKRIFIDHNLKLDY